MVQVIILTVHILVHSYIKETDLITELDDTQRNKDERVNRGQSYSLVSGTPKESIGSNAWMIQKELLSPFTLKQAATTP